MSWIGWIGWISSKLLKLAKRFKTYLLTYLLTYLRLCKRPSSAQKGSKKIELPTTNNAKHQTPNNKHSKPSQTPDETAVVFSSNNLYLSACKFL